MSTCIRTGLFAVTFAAIAATSSAAADISVATKWRMTGEAQSDCMNHAATALYRAGFNQADPGSQSITGKAGDYVASIRCVSEQNIVFFVLSGPSADRTSRYLEALYGSY